MKHGSTRKSLVNYLLKYQDFQEYIFLVSHPTLNSNWSDRCLYGTNKYDPHKHYNHRSILRNEVVIEYDFEEDEKNRRLVMIINKKLLEQGFATSLWFSGGKSYHLHTFINIPSGIEPRDWKKSFIYKVTEGLPKPDMLTTSDNHLIRAECGIHEKTQRYKTLCSESHSYPYIKDVTSLVMPGYLEHQSYINSLPTCTNDLVRSEEAQYLLDASNLREKKDGVQRALFVLTHVLKEEMSKEEVKAYLKKWYRAAGGYKTDVDSHVDYQWDKPYAVVGHLKNLVYDLKHN